MVTAGVTPSPVVQGMIRLMPVQVVVTFWSIPVTGADYIVHDNQDGTYLITDTRPGSPDGTDTVITSGSLEDLQFADQTVGLATAVTAVSLDRL